MARPKKLTPSYLLHKTTNRGRLVWTDSIGCRHERLLPGEYNSQQSLEAKAKLELEIAATPTGALIEKNAVSVNELFLAFLLHAQEHYRREDGSNTHELDEYKLVVRYVRELYGETLAAEFGPLCLKAVRQKFIDAGWCRNLVNMRISRVKRMFKWGASEELCPVAVPQALATVQGLLRGRSNVRESKPVEAVPDEVVDATLPFLNRHVRGLVQFQRLTGCRPGEACAIRRCDIDMGGSIWLYKPTQHKTAWRGKARVVSIGPKAQALLKEFFTPKIDDYLFSPVRAVEEFHAERAANRATPCYPSHMKRNEKIRKKNPKRKPAEMYDVNSYGHAIDRACGKAFPPPGELAKRQDESETAWWARLTAEQRQEVKRWQKAHQWAPNRIRHLFGTKVRKGYGLEAAGAGLGHSKMSATEVYAAKDQALAAKVASEIG